jgi:hypothetical protein
MGRHYVWGRKSEDEMIRPLSGPYLSRAIARNAAIKAQINGYINVVIRASAQDRIPRFGSARRCR